MQSPVTGNRGRGATSKMRCVDVAALFAAAVLRRNSDSMVIRFDDRSKDQRDHAARGARSVPGLTPGEDA